MNNKLLDKLDAISIRTSYDIQAYNQIKAALQDYFKLKSGEVPDEFLKKKAIEFINTMIFEINSFCYEPEEDANEGLTRITIMNFLRQFIQAYVGGGK